MSVAFTPGSGPASAPIGRPFTPTSGIAEGGSGGGAMAGATLLVIIALSSVALLQGAETQRVALTAALALILFSLISISPVAGVSTSLVYLMLVSGLKRGLIPILGYSALDPLLLVVPGVVLLFFVNRILQRQLPQETPIAKYILWLVVVMAVQILNPLQGGIMIGLGGILYTMVPTLWFYISRRTASTHILEVLFSCFVAVAFLGGCYGLYQTWFGFTDVEKQWLILTKNDSSLHLSAATRVFSVFSSFAEYCHILVVSFAVCVARSFSKKRLYVLPALFFFVCIVLSSSRGTLLGALVTLTVLWAVQGKTIKSWLPRLALALVLAAASISVGADQVANSKFDPITQDLLSHQTKGLTNALDNNSSTGASHLALTFNGMTSGLRNPLGSGLGAGTLAAGKFGSNVGGTEGDFGNMFVSLGLVGGVLYLTVVYLVMRKSVEIWRVARSQTILTVLGILLAEFGVWLLSGHYSTTMLIWYCIGWLSRCEVMDKMKKEAEQKKQRAERKNAPTAGNRPQRFRRPSGFPAKPARS